MKIGSVGLLFLFLLNFAPAQDFEEIQKWNSGISIGGGGVHYFFVPSVDIMYKFATLRIAPSPWFSVGFSYDIFRIPIRETNFSYFCASLYYMRFDDNFKLNLGKLHINPDDKDMVSLLAGVKLRFFRRMYSQIQIGMNYTRVRRSGNLSLPEDFGRGIMGFYGEISIGVTLYDHFRWVN